MDEITTIEECDIALSILMEYAEHIDVDLDHYVKLRSRQVHDTAFDEAWCMRARGALGYKRSAIRAVERLRKNIADKERQSFFEFIGSVVGDETMDGWRKQFSRDRKEAERAANHGN
ncbi:hypothetical protein [Allorhizobium borbori]|uniref:Uncharacterized protein n=1 Tax=Allorhizobium borbori TaxID=485907 RepID=A0A7W6P0F2_9HYPH|nr:hypothetical protein [Allorhizobium borbori]MBB4102383.1 hypothetical protein [Allorhizobium borbori]